MAVGEMGSLPLGLRFLPTDEELIDFYLRFNINGQNDHVFVIREMELRDLPDLSMIPTKDPEWFFFSPQDQKYPRRSKVLANIERKRTKKKKFNTYHNKAHSV